MHSDGVLIWEIGADGKVCWIHVSVMHVDTFMQHSIHMCVCVAEFFLYENECVLYKVFGAN